MDAWHDGLDGQPVIEADSLVFSYENSRAESLRVDDLRLPAGTLTVLCGASGSGKSTFLRLLNGLIPDYYQGRLSGRLTVDGLRAGQKTVEEFSRSVASVFQNPSSQFFHKIVKHELVLPCENQGKPAQQILAQLDRLTQDFSLQADLERDLFTLSGGEKQRVALLTALMQDIPIMVLDELQQAKKKRAPKVGDDILVTSYGQRGTLTRQLKDGRWEAQVGLIKMTLEEQEFNLLKADKDQQPKSKQVNVVKRTNGGGPRARLDLRGKRYEEAMEELDAFIDQALLNNMAQVDIIHGIGTGVIREGVTKYLRRNKQVKSFGYAPQNAGGSGATIVVFK